MLYHKYRPIDFNEMIGNKKVIESLKSIIEKENKPHVFLFTGYSGCGKTTAARICATKYISESYIEEINSSNNRGIDTARQIVEQIKSYPVMGTNWVYIIDEVHKTTNEWQNAMLKVLEDTPAHVYFFLCTTDPQKLLKTLKTRCIQFVFSQIEKKYLIRLLKRINRQEEGRVNSDVIDIIVDKAEGSARIALTLLEKVINEEPENATLLLEEEKEEKEIIDLCRALIRNSEWEDISNILQNLKEKQDVENIRHVVMGYMSSILLKKRNMRAYTILEEFIEPFYNSGWPGLVLACFRPFLDDAPF